MAEQPSPKRARKIYNTQELERLESVFSINTYPDRRYRDELASELRASQKNIQIWFQNRRARERTLQRKEMGIVEDPIERMKRHWKRGASPAEATPQTSSSQNENSFSSSSMSPCNAETVWEHNARSMRQERPPLRDRNSEDNRHNVWTTIQPDESACSGVNLYPRETLAPTYPPTASAMAPEVTQVFNEDFGGDRFCSQGRLNQNLDDGAYFGTLQRRPKLESVSNISDISNSSFAVMNNQPASSEEPPKLCGFDAATLALFSPTFSCSFDFQ